MKDYEGDALAISDEQVAADWRMGVLRGVARVMKDGAEPLAGRARFGVVEGSPLAHLSPQGLFGSFGEGCKIAELYDLEEAGGKEYIFGTGGGSEYDTIRLSAKANCACGKLVKEPVEMNVPPGDLIASVLRAG